MMMLLTAILAGVVICAVMVVHVLSSAKNLPRADSPAPFTCEHERCRLVAVRLEEAKSAMRARGTTLLLEGRNAWPRVSGGHVVPLRRA